MAIWWKGSVINLIGIGAVATIPTHRKKGVAAHLLQYALDLIDQQEQASVLFTNVPAVYEKHGFKIVDQQHYRSISVTQIAPNRNEYRHELIEVITDEHVSKMQYIYRDIYPNYDGKVVRDEEYWEAYKMWFNPYQKPKIVFCSSGEKLAGYARFETENDRLIISELCCGKDDTAVIESLFAYVADYARPVSYTHLRAHET